MITFIYTAQIQLYSFQMRLTIKNTRMNNYLVCKLQHYIIISEKAFLKR